MQYTHQMNSYVRLVHLYRFIHIYIIHIFSGMLIFFVRRYKITFHMTHTCKRHHKNSLSLKKHPLIKISSICALFYNIFSFPLHLLVVWDGGLLLQWTLRAAALRGGLHLFRKGRSVGALEADFPLSALGGGAAEA